jgi:hypothetical protein
MIRLVLVAAFLGLAAWPALAQDRAGVATTVEGNVTVARQAVRPTALKFKDDVFLRDTVATGDQSFARLLLGGKAVVSVRERSSLRITEVPGRSTVEIDSGKIGMAVARDRMRPGEVIDIRTPNAVLAVRGTVLVVEVVQATASAASQPGAWTTLVHVLSGIVDALQLDPVTGRPLGSTTPINSNFSYSVTGSGAPRVAPTPPGQVGQITAGLQPKGQAFAGGDSLNQIKTQVIGLSTQLVNNVAGSPPPPPPPSAPPTTTEVTPPILPGGESTVAPPTPPGPTPGDSLITNGDFETGNFQGWTLTGAGMVIPAFEGVTSSNVAILHTGGNALLFPKGAPGCPACRQGSTLTQEFESPRLIRVGGVAAILSNEFPEFTGGQSQFNDFFAVTVIDAKGQRHTVFQVTVNELNSAFVPVEKDVTIGDFTLFAPGGAALVGEFGRSLVVAPGEATLELSVFDVNDTFRDTAVVFDGIVVRPDPPLHFVHDRHLDRGGALLTMIREQRAVDAVLVVCCTGSARLGGPILDATDSTLDAPFSVTTIIQGGRLTSTSAGSLVALDGGRYRLGPLVGIFDLGGTRSALDPETGLVLGTDEPLRHAGTFVEARGATIDTASAVRLDTALLEASRPIVSLLRGSTMNVGDQFVDVFHGTLAAGGPIARLDGSTLNVAGSLVRVTGGVFEGAGSLVTLADGSTLRVGALGNVSSGGRFNWTGPLATFTGADNTLAIRNSLCAASDCVDVNGIRVALRNGATADNVKIRNDALFAGEGTSGHVKLGRDAAHFVLTGPSSRVRIR